MRSIILNRVDERSLYKRALHEVLKAKGDTLILGYGYISEEIFSENNFIKDIKEGFYDSKDINEIILIGCKNVDCNNYIEAARKLEKNFEGVVIKLLIKDLEYSKYLDSTTKNNIRRTYHKKLAIKLDRKKYEKDDYNIKIGLLGSSNLTNPAYRDGDETYYNKYGNIETYEINTELDILVWNPYEIKKDFNYYINKKSKKIENLTDLDKSEYKLDLSSMLELYDIVDEVYNYRDNKFNMIILDEKFPHSYITKYFKINSYKSDALKRCLSYYYLQLKDEEGYRITKNNVKYISQNGEELLDYNIFIYNKDESEELNEILYDKSEFMKLIDSNNINELIEYVLSNKDSFNNQYEFIKEIILLYNKYKESYTIRHKEKEIAVQQSLFDIYNIE